MAEIVSEDVMEWARDLEALQKLFACEKLQDILNSAECKLQQKLPSSQENQPSDATAKV